MKNTLLLITVLLCQFTNLFAQEPQLVGDALEYRTVVTFENTSATVLYSKALSAVSKISSKKMSSSMDLKDDEGKHLIYKYTDFLGTKKKWEMYCDVILDIRCKDGRVQFIVNVPTLKFQHSTGVNRSYSFRTAVEEREKQSDNKRDENGATVQASEMCKNLVYFLTNEMKLDPDDDF